MGAVVGLVAALEVAEDEEGVVLEAVEAVEAVGVVVEEVAEEEEGDVEVVGAEVESIS